VNCRIATGTSVSIIDTQAVEMNERQAGRTGLL